MSPLFWLNKSIGTYNIKGIYIEPTYWQAAAIIFLLFLLVLTFARLRHLYVHWSVGKPAMSMLFWGFLLAVVLEGFLLLSGKTFLTVIFGWKNAPKPISTALDIGREKLTKVLGANDQTATEESVMTDFQSLPPNEADAVKNFICKPQ
ncbi:hypothetical protein A2955_03860 [Candidatus Woesebacteria bacterium RIFCSPLOWO2_01_FULL_37_19]|uniref:Uncharacterized protein n=1 Tax=Candidatus Woesebacteria bacterium RIFCSPLOWO2_01_FULL_37_19 TaxID=1802514 RepID=A0A1F8B8F9_9BACT|nr:MAG: hypothetical protein A2955_03860 [Candidatus Woesebacteria bacterium RIFCSPLOWO2_01_FULL_37_19]